MSALSIVAAFALWLGADAHAEDALVENFDNQPETRWRFFTDNVMGGVSTGRVEFVEEDGDVHGHMTGSVSTENDGGFIQIRMELPAPPAAGTAGLWLIVRGNDQRYFVHLRTTGTLMPWQYYQAGFQVTREWSEVRLPFSAFKASGRLLPTTPKPETLKSVGIVAYGRNHAAEIDVREVGFYQGTTSDGHSDR